MNNLTLQFARKILLALAFVAAAGSVSAQTTTFAQFVQNGGGNVFLFNNLGTQGDFTTAPGGVPVFFFYQGIVGLDPSLQGLQFAHMHVSSTTTQPATSASGTLTQPFNQTITIRIIRDTPAPVGFNTQDNLLTAVISPAGLTPAVTGTDGGNSGSTPSSPISTRLLRSSATCSAAQWRWT